MALKEFFMGKKTAKAAGKRNVDNVVKESVTGKKPAPKAPVKTKMPTGKVPAKRK